jgi:hypothetical protein
MRQLDDSPVDFAWFFRTGVDDFREQAKKVLTAKIVADLRPMHERLDMGRRTLGPDLGKGAMIPVIGCTSHSAVAAGDSG